MSVEPSNAPGQSLDSLGQAVTSPSNEEDLSGEGASLTAGIKPLIERIARALELSTEAGVGREHRIKLQALDHFRELHRDLLEFSAFLQEATPLIEEASKKAGELGKVNRLSERASLGIYSSMIDTWDGWTREFADLAANNTGLLEALSHFLEEETQTKVTDSLVDTQDSSALAENVEKLESEFGGLEHIVQELERSIHTFPKVCRGFVRELQSFHRSLLNRFGVDDDETEEKTTGFSFMDIFKPSPPKKLDVPIYKKNTHLTAFLAELSDMIPTPTTDKERAATELERFKVELNAVADKQVLEWARTQQMYMRVARVLQNSHAFYMKAFDALAESGVVERFKEEPGRVSSNYERLLQNAREKSSGSSQGDEAFKSFDSSELIKAVYDFKPYTKVEVNTEKPDEAEKDDESAENDDRAQKYLDLFEKLEVTLDSIANKKKAKVVNGLIDELLEMKKGLSKSEERRVTARLSRDKKLGIYAYEPRQGTHGKLSLHRVPSENVKYEDVVGHSWTTVKELLEPLLQNNDLGYLYSFGTMRGRQNNNMLVLGPYGCGKNMFLRALQADPRMISVKMSYDRIVTPWAHQSEVNARLLYEQTHQKRIEHDRAGVVCWDEFDTLFGDPKRRSIGGVTDNNDAKIKKTLQSIWDGDTIYEGVSTIALSNAPAAIPPAIYRRFGHVVVIKPLDEEERKTLVTKLMAGLPKAPGFEESVDWESFLVQSELATGDLLGKVYDRVFRGFVSKFEDAHPDGPKEANDRFKKLATGAKPIGAPERLEIFSETAPGVVVTPDEFQEAYTHVLGLSVNRNQMEQTGLFYEYVNERIAEAFKGVE